MPIIPGRANHFEDWIGKFTYTSRRLQKDKLEITCSTQDTIRALIIESPNPNGHILVWGHWLGPEISNWNQYKQEAQDFALLGYNSILFEAPWSAPDWYDSRSLEKEHLEFLSFFRALSALFDFASQRAKLLHGKLFLIAHDYSAMFSLPLLSLSSNFDGAILKAFTYSFYDWAFYKSVPKDWMSYHKENDVYELSTIFYRVRTPIYLQFAEEDIFVSSIRREQIISALNPREAIIYKDLIGDPHFLNSEQVKMDQKRWIENICMEKLKI